jgi:hypothetical protein
VIAVAAAKQAQALLYGEMLRQAAMLAFIDVFWVLGVLCVGMTPRMFVLKKSAMRGPPPPAPSIRIFCG